MLERLVKKAAVVFRRSDWINHVTEEIEKPGPCFLLPLIALRLHRVGNALLDLGSIHAPGITYSMED